MNTHNFINTIAQELKLQTNQVKNVMELLESGATIPFIARYRKEASGMLDEVEIGNIRDRNKQLVDLENRRETILKSIDEQGFLTDLLKEKIGQASTLFELEDLYLPYKPKRKTRASMAKERGLEPLAKIIMAQQDFDLTGTIIKYVNPKKGVESVEAALDGARDIIAEWISEHQYTRTRIRHFYMHDGVLSSTVVKTKKEEADKYSAYFDFKEPISKSASHRILAIFRAENEGFLKVKLAPDENKALDFLQKQFVKTNNAASKEVEKACVDSYKRLIQPSIENEIRQYYKEKADKKAIEVFAENMRQLLLTPPLGEKTVLAIDPGFRTGCKVVILSPQGKLLHNETIYPHPPQNERNQAKAKLARLVATYKVEAIAIGNGTAGRETEHFVKKTQFDRNVMAVVVNESGASIYSASAIAREEFPNYDVTVRGSVSIGRRLMDPLAELVKIDPKSIGVGQYQHDVDQKLLQESLTETVESCVNKVGVELNTASKELLSYVSGIGPTLAQNIVAYRNENGAFKNRKALLKVPRFGAKSFEQAAGFLRVRESDHPLDKSAVHPESYPIVEKMAKKLNCTIEDLMKDESLRLSIPIEEFVTDTVGMPTLRDILSELAKPGLDPRTKFEHFEFDPNIKTIKDLSADMTVRGIVTNITAFGVFVDIGIHENGFIHISELADEFVKDPNDYVKLNEKITAKIISVDIERKRIALSCKK
ncbi:MAG: Tex family protein [Bacteroidales bacterium]|nr:Tex family protein [Bacteroidales bacterium]MDY0217155.1 Tex family protein [Bacteroidales bacterium]